MPAKLRAISSPQLAAKPRNRRKQQSSVIAAVRAAAAPESRLASFVGLVLGGFIPLASFVVCHSELAAAKGLTYVALQAIVAGGLLFSAKTVWQWGRLAFADPWKATGFVLLLEGVMIVSGVAPLSYGALGLLIAINGIATGCQLSRPEGGKP